MKLTCWECGNGPVILAEDAPEYPVSFCFGCRAYSTMDLAALAMTERGSARDE